VSMSTEEIIRNLQGQVKTNEEQALKAEQELRELKARYGSYTPDDWKKDKYFELKALAEKKVQEEFDLELQEKYGELKSAIRTRNVLFNKWGRAEHKRLLHYYKLCRVQAAYRSLSRYVTRLQKANRTLKGSVEYERASATQLYSRVRFLEAEVRRLKEKCGEPLASYEK
jgi:hypothetical protein